MKKFKIRFNTECPDKGAANALCWRAVINGEEVMVSDVEINVPTRTIDHTLENGMKKWSIYCESDNYYIDDKGKLTINEAGKYSPVVIWITGLSSSGKSIIANSLHEKLRFKGQKSIILDGDDIRHFFQIGFDKKSRIEHNDNVARMASLFEAQGFIVIVSLISPYVESRDKARKLCNNFLEVYLNTPLEICEKRDVKGLYKQAREGEIKDFTGINSPYEIPENPDLSLNTEIISIKECVDKIMDKIANISFKH